MEKPAVGLRKIAAGLLIYLFAAAAALARPSWDSLWNMHFEHDETLFTSTDCAFSVEIENITPDTVQLAVNSLPNYVRFVSYKKETVIAKSGSGAFATKITIYLNFEKTGTYKIRPIDVMIEENNYRIQFERVEVYENPRFIKPEIFVKFKNRSFETKPEVSAGDHVEFTICTRFATQVFDIDWQIPEDALFTVLWENDKPLKIHSGDFSSAVYEVATFDWQPLTTGTSLMPDISISLESYAGENSTMKIDRTKFKVNSSTRNPYETKKKANPFAYAFADINSEGKSMTRNLTDEDVKKLWEFHCKERHSLPLISKEYKQRKSFEKEVGIAEESSEASVVLLMVLIVLSSVLGIAGATAFAFRRRKISGVILSFFVVFFLLAIFYGSRCSKNRGIYKGGTMRAIPEKNIPSGAAIESGSIVTISRRAGSWMYIKFSDTYGWVESDEVLVIE